MRVFWRLLRFTGPVAGWMLLSAGLGFATVASSIGLMATSAYIVSKAALHPSIAVLQVAIVGVRFFGLTRGGFRYLERYVSHRTTFTLLAELRVWFYRALEPLAPARLMQYRSGDLFSRIVADIQNLENFFVRVVSPTLAAGLVLALMWVLLAGYSQAVAAVTLIFLLAAALIAPASARLLSKQPGAALVIARAELNAALVDGVQGIADLLLAGQSESHGQTIDSLSRALERLQNRMAWIAGLQAALLGAMTHWAALAVLVVAVPLVSAGRLDGVYLAVIVLAVLAGFEAIAPLPEAAQQLQSNLTAAGRLFEMVDTLPAVADPPEPLDLPAQSDLSVREVSFRYGPDEPPALQNVSFSVAPGEQVALVGPSGAGKSTLVSLLLRFWELQTGEIRLGGVDVRRLRADDVRRAMSVVSQDAYLFSGTIRENLLLANPAATEAGMLAAARQAQLHTFVQSLPQGYDTWIGEHGLRLSGGQRQRLSIARALLKDAPILILDEAAANLDPLVEQSLWQILRPLLARRCTLIVTHRLAGLEAVNRIVVLEQGRPIEQGTHRDLLARRGLYYRLWRQSQLDALGLVD